MARSRSTQALGAGTGRVSRGGRADQSSAYFRGHEAASVVGGRERAHPKRDALYRANAVAADASLQQERESDDRKAVPHPLDFRRAFAANAGTFGGESEPCARASYAYDGDRLVLRGGLRTHKHVFKSELKSG